MSSVLNELCDMLECYRGRDKIIRLLCYTTKLMSALSYNEDTSKRFARFSSKMGQTRATLRLLDDLPALKRTIEYGSGKQEPDRFMASIGITSNIIDNVFYPIEKMSWLAEHDIIDSSGQPWDVCSSVCWVATTYLTFIKTIRLFVLLHNQKIAARNDGNFEELHRIYTIERIETLTMIRCMFDLVHSIQTLPAGFLWSSQLKTWQVGLIGTISSVLGIYQMFVRRALKH